MNEMFNLSSKILTTKLEKNLIKYQKGKNFNKHSNRSHILYQKENFPCSVKIVSFGDVEASTCPMTLASSLKEEAISIRLSAADFVTYNSIRCPMLNTLYISFQSVPDCSCIRRKRGGVGKRLFLTIC